jgi:hypothetical protein
MPVLKPALFIFFSALTLSVCAQPDSTFQLSRIFKGNFVDFSVDNLGNIYTVNTQNRLKKSNAAGDSLAVYNDVRQFGRMSYMDVTSPLKILLYYREFATIVMVDRYLNIINTIDLRKQNIFQARAIGLSYDNNVWVYDEQEAKLKKIDDSGNLLTQTTDIRQFVDAVPDPVSIIDQNGLVYLFDESKGIYIFDHYGAFQHQIPIADLRDFSVIDKNLLARNDQYFFRYETGGLNALQIPIPADYLPAIKICLRPDAVYVLKTNSLEIYSRR